MTPSKINTLSGRELEAAIAINLFNWERAAENGEDKNYGYSPTMNKDCLPYGWPDYLTDYNLIFGSGGVVEKMKDRGFRFDLVVYPDGTGYVTIGKGISRFTSMADIPASCLRCALIAHFSEKETQP